MLSGGGLALQASGPSYRCCAILRWVAWLGQIVLLVMLGLLRGPSRPLAVAGQGLVIALVLIVVAQPIAVPVSAFRFHCTWRELTDLRAGGPGRCGPAQPSAAPRW